MAMNPRLLRPTANDSPASIPGLALWLDASASDALYTTDAGPVSAVSSPLDISGCVGWWDADDDSTVSVDANDKVTAWADKSGSGYSMDQATESRRPLYLASGINGRKSIEFDIANGRQLIGAFTESMTAATVFVVNVVPDQASNAGRMLTLWPNDAVNNQDTTGSSSWVPLVRGTSNAFYSSLVAGPSYVAGYVVPQFGSQQILTAQHSGTAISQFYNGSLYGAGSHTLNATFTHIGINTYTLLAFAGYSNQTTGEVIVYNTALSTSDRARVEAYLAAKWGISGVHAPAVTASQPVGYWRDRSGNGRHATQSTAASRPVVGSQNGRRSLSFDASNDWMTLGSQTIGGNDLLADADNAFSLFFVVRRAGGGVNTLFAKASATLGNRTLQVFSSNGDFAAILRGTQTVGSTGSLPSDADTLVRVSWSGTAAVAAINSAGEIALSAGSAAVESENITIGARTASSPSVFWGGLISEIVAYSRALSTAERRKIERYLARRWGITLAPQVSNAEAQDWINRVYAAGSTVSQPVANAVSAFVDGCQADGIWDAMKSVVLLAGADTLAGALAPLKGTAPTSSGFVGGDYNKTAGLTSRAAGNTFLDTNRAGSADPQDSFHAAVYLTNISDVYVAAHGPSGGGMMTLATTGARNRSGTAGSFASTALAPGLVGSSRSASGAFDLIANGTVSTASIASGTPGTENTKIPGYVYAGIYSNNRFSFYSIGEAVDLALLDARVNSLMSSIGVT